MQVRYENFTIASCSVTRPREQLRACGIDRGAIQYRIGIGRLHPVFTGVFAVGTPQDSRLGFFRAATLSAGEDAVVSHFSSGQLFEVFRGRVGEIHLTCPRRLRDRGRLRIHQGEVPTDVRHGIPTTTIEQTLVDLGAVMFSDRAYTRAVREALVQELTTYGRLTDFASDRRAGAPRLRKVLAAGDVRTRSRPEDDFLALVLQAGMPMPLVNVRLHGFEVDFFWPEHGVVVEVDGEVHDNPLARAHDRRKQAILESHGLRVLRVRADEIGEAALRRLHAALDSDA